MAISLFGCNKKTGYETGGKVDNTNYLAPKTFKSKNIVEFSAYFYLELDEPLDDNYTSQYDFKIEDHTLSETIRFKVSEKIDDSVLKDLQAIIDKYKLTELNGVDCHTAGLPPEFQPYYVTVKYDSDEVLSFSENNNPSSPWAKEMVTLFRKTLIDLGHSELEPSKEASTIERFRMAFNVDNVGYEYSPIIMEEDVVKLIKHSNNFDDKTGISEVSALEDDLYEGLSKLIIELDTKRFHTGRLATGNECPHTKDGYYEIYIDFKNGKQIYGYSTDKEQVEDFSKDKIVYMNFFDDYMDSHGKEPFK